MLEKINLIKDYIRERKYLIGYIILFIFIILILFYFIVFDNDSSRKDEVKEIERKEISKIVQDNLENKNDICINKVDIKGFVERPGLYDIECEKRVNDVINLAGGLKSNADTSVINLGKKVFDQMVIIIYSKDDVKNFNKIIEDEVIKEEKCINNDIVKNDACITKENKSESSYSIISIPTNNNENSNFEINSEKNKLVNINIADVAELMTLSGVGESKAKAIISYRDENGLFKNIDEIKNVVGIGDKMFEKIKDFITV